ncbi:hypothetical protein M8A51_15125 [Schlegelella sp. S2-27]|uniref:Toxin CptA n=1 Tax=Caldimonas mangrovi TaxID=2944811 RepID=A0ABT0YQ51_9BURK|nr:hypothetical protein [Caldimonas mangrovi]MCM5680856.1 hypothetical protein [Caldimonas mangrovi]
MRTAPALQVTVNRFDRWRAALACAAIAAPTATAAWWQTSSVPRLPGAALCLFCVLLSVVLWRAERRRAPHVLHWDGQLWHWGAAQMPDDRRCTGKVEVALDLGRWMLLRLQPCPGAGARASWLPVQAAGLERSWHALRCAVYSPTLGDRSPGRDELPHA